MKKKIPKQRNIKDTVIVLKGKGFLSKQIILNFHRLSPALSLQLERSQAVSAASSVDPMPPRGRPLRTDFKRRKKVQVVSQW